MDFSLPESCIKALNSLPASESTKTKLCDYVSLLHKWNQKTNLTGSKSTEEIASDHVLDSLLAAKHLPVTEALIDIGTGAGFPGLVLAMVWTDREIHLVEPKEKSVIFLKEAVKNLGLQNVTVHPLSVEDLQGDELVPIYQESFTISRAFSPMKKFFGYCDYLVHEDAPLFLMTGENSESLDPTVLEKSNLLVFKSTNYDSSKPKKILVEIRPKE